MPTMSDPCDSYIEDIEALKEELARAYESLRIVKEIAIAEARRIEWAIHRPWDSSAEAYLDSRHILWLIRDRITEALSDAASSS